MNIKIGVCFHKETEVHDYIKNKKIYLPIFAGKKLYQGNSLFLNKMQGDDIGDNISNLNKNLNEVTVIYWMGKHLNELNNPDYIGLFHYRRFLKFNLNELNKNTIFVNKYDFKGLSIFNQIIFAETTPEIFNFYLNLYLMFNQSDYKLLNNFLKETYLYACNMFIMPKNIFNDYFKFLNFNIKLCKLLLEYKSEWFISKPRMLGMFLERMTGFYIYKMKNQGILIKECEIIGEQNK